MKVFITRFWRTRGILAVDESEIRMMGRYMWVAGSNEPFTDKHVFLSIEAAKAFVKKERRSAIRRLKGQLQELEGMTHAQMFGGSG